MKTINNSDQVLNGYFCENNDEVATIIVNTHTRDVFVDNIEFDSGILNFHMSENAGIISFVAENAREEKILSRQKFDNYDKCQFVYLLVDNSLLLAKKEG